MMTRPGEDGYELWLRYRVVDDPERLRQYRAAIAQVVVSGTSATAEIIRRELCRALAALLDREVPSSTVQPHEPVVIVGTLQELAGLGITHDRSDRLDEEGFFDPLPARRDCDYRPV